MSRLTRHEILKEDKFLTVLDAAREFFRANRKQLVIGVSGLGLLVLIVLGTRYFFAQQDEKVKDELSHALRTYHASVGASATSTSEPVFATTQEKLEKALAEFQKLGVNHASRPAGKIAKYYAGLCLRELNKTNEAISILEPLSKEKSDYGVLAEQALATVYESNGNFAKAAEVYQQIVQRDSAVVSKSDSLMHLAQMYEQQHKPAEATKIYQQVIKDFPATTHMTEAEQKLKQLSR